MPCLGGAPPYPRGGDRRRRPLAPDPGRSHGVRGPEVFLGRHLFCKAVMLAKEEAKRLRERLAADLRLRHDCIAERGDGLGTGDRRRASISGHRRRGLAGDEQRVARRPIRTKPVRRRVVFHARLKELSVIAVGPRHRANCLPGSRDPFKRDTAHPGTWVTEGTYRVFSQ